MNRRQRARRKARAQAHTKGYRRPLSPEELLALDKATLKQLAEDRGMAVKSKTTKKQMVDHICGVAA